VSESEHIISDSSIQESLTKLGFTQSPDEGRLMLVELLAKASAGYYNSHTEEAFLKSQGVLLAGRLPNKRGRKFICSMIYTHSNRRPECFKLMEKYRQ